MRHLFLITALCVATLATMLAGNAPDAAAQGKRIVFIGDSITDGMWGCGGGFKPTSAERNHTDFNHIYGHGYMMLIAADYQSRRPKAGYEFFNRGISGHKLTDLAARWKEDVLDLDPDVVSVLIGTNDAGAFIRGTYPESFTIEDWKDLYRSLLRQAREKNPDVRLVLCTPFVSKGRGAQDYDRREPLTRELATAVREVGKEFGAVIVPYDELFAKLNAKEPSPGYWMWDGIHPTAAGHRRMADLWEKRVKL